MVQLWSYAHLSTCGTFYPIRTLGAPASSFGIDTRHRQCSDDPPYHSALQTRPASPDAPPSPAARSPNRALCIAFHFASSRSSQIWEPLCWLLDLSSSAAAAASSIESVSVRRPLPSASACEGYCGHARGITAMLGGIIPIADYSSPWFSVSLEFGRISPRPPRLCLRRPVLLPALAVSPSASHLLTQDPSE